MAAYAIGERCQNNDLTPFGGETDLKSLDPQFKMPFSPTFTPKQHSEQAPVVFIFDGIKDGNLDTAINRMGFPFTSHTDATIDNLRNFGPVVIVVKHSALASGKLMRALKECANDPDFIPSCTIKLM